MTRTCYLLEIVHSSKIPTSQAAENRTIVILTSLMQWDALCSEAQIPDHTVCFTLFSACSHIPPELDILWSMSVFFLDEELFIVLSWLRSTFTRKKLRYGVITKLMHDRTSLVQCLHAIRLHEVQDEKHLSCGCTHIL